jgi:hypothetical protein
VQVVLDAVPHLFSGADKGADQETDVADPAADVENAHARTDSGAAQHPFGQRPEDLGLFDQPLIFGLAAAKGTIGVRHVVASLTGARPGGWHGRRRNFCRAD